MKHTHVVEGSRATNPPSAPAAAPDALICSLPNSECPNCDDRLSSACRESAPAGTWDNPSPPIGAAPDAQTPRTDAAWKNEVHTTSGAVDLSAAINLSRQLERENADLRKELESTQTFAQTQFNIAEDLRRQLAERTFEKESFAADAIQWQKIARENEAALAAEQLRCKVAEERRDALSGELAAERAAREAAEQRERDARSELDSLPSGDLQKLGARLADLLSEDRWNEVEPMLQAALIERMQAERDRDAAADLAREEAARIAQKYLGGSVIADTIRSTITDPAAVKRTMEDAVRYNMLFRDTWRDGQGIAIFRYTRPHDDFERLGIAEATELLDAARKGKEGKR